MGNWTLRSSARCFETCFSADYAVQVCEMSACKKLMLKKCCPIYCFAILFSFENIFFWVENNQHLALVRVTKLFVFFYSEPE